MLIKIQGKRNQNKTDEALLIEFRSGGDLEVLRGALLKIYTPCLRGMPQVFKGEGGIAGCGNADI